MIDKSVIKFLNIQAEKQISLFRKATPIYDEI